MTIPIAFLRLFIEYVSIGGKFVAGMKPITLPFSEWRLGRFLNIKAADPPLRCNGLLRVFLSSAGRSHPSRT